MTQDEVIAFLGPSWEKTLELIRGSLTSDIRLLNDVNGTLLSHSGKMLRPMLGLLCASACMPDHPLPEDSCRFAAASELLHNASLLHDDVVDASSERRGSPTVRSVLGGPASVLIGDFWLVKAIEVVLGTSRFSEAAIRIFAKTLADLSEGEMLQLEKTGSCDTTEADYARIIYSKTASLFEAAAVTGALSVGASEVWTEGIRRYAVALGMAFQIRDDMMDYGDGGDIGKPVGADLREQKITLPLLGALAAVSPEEAAVIRQRVCRLVQHPEDELGIRLFVAEKDGLAYARKRMEDYLRDAVEALGVLPESPARTYLQQIALYVGAREV